MIIVLAILAIVIVGLLHENGKLCDEIGRLEKANKELQRRAHGLE